MLELIANVWPSSSTATIVLGNAENLDLRIMTVPILLVLQFATVNTIEMNADGRN